MGKTCQICGNNSGIYPLCKTHLEMKNKGEIIKCQKCQLWHLKDKSCNCIKLSKNELNIGMIVKSEKYGKGIINNIWKYKNKEYLSLKVQQSNDIEDYVFYEYYLDEACEDFSLIKDEINENNFKNNEENKIKKDEADYKKENAKNIVNQINSNCLICGNKTQDNFLFCKEHYAQYKNKSILIKITNCTEVEFISELSKYEDGLVYTCKDGHRVRSKSEVIIDNYLYDHNIKHAYEKSYPIDDNKEHDLHPDFFLPDLNLYIEHWGYTNKANYQEEKEYKTKIYNKDKTTVIGTTEEDTTDIETSLTRKLKFYEKGKVN